MKATTKFLSLLLLVAMLFSVLTLSVSAENSDVLISTAENGCTATADNYDHFKQTPDKLIDGDQATKWIYRSIDSAPAGNPSGEYTETPSAYLTWDEPQTVTSVTFYDGDESYAPLEIPDTYVTNMELSFYDSTDADALPVKTISVSDGVPSMGEKTVILDAPLSGVVKLQVKIFGMSQLENGNKSVGFTEIEVYGQKMNDVLISTADKGCAATADNQDHVTQGPEKLIDGDYNSRWVAKGNATEPSAYLSWNAPQTVSSITFYDFTDLYPEYGDMVVDEMDILFFHAGEETAFKTYELRESFQTGEIRSVPMEQPVENVSKIQFHILKSSGGYFNNPGFAEIEVYAPAQEPVEPEEPKNVEILNGKEFSAVAGSADSGNNIYNLVSGSGMSDAGSALSLDATHDVTWTNMWTTAHNPGEDAWLIVDLGQVRELDEMWIWNYNRAGALQNRGMKNVKIEYAKTLAGDLDKYSYKSEDWTALAVPEGMTFTDGNSDYPFQFATAAGNGGSKATNLNDRKHSPVSFNGAEVRYVRLSTSGIAGDGNWGLDTWDQNLHGLAELRFTAIPLPELETVADPTVTPDSGRYDGKATVEMRCATEGASIYYTIDGSEPTAESTLYTTPFTVEKNVTVKAIAVKENAHNSQIVTREYVISIVDKLNGEIYVAPNGSDETGDGSQSKPFATVDKARDYVRSINGKMTKDITVHIAAGKYYLSEPIVFNEQDSGTEDYKIIYKADDGLNTVELIGGYRVEGEWTLLTGDEEGRDAYLPDSANGKVYKLNVGTDYNFNTLYVNDRRATMARFPNEDTESKFVSARAPYLYTAGGGPRDLYYNKSDVPQDIVDALVYADEHGELDAQIYIWDGDYWDWMSSTIPLGKIDAANNHVLYKYDPKRPELYIPHFGTGYAARYLFQGCLGMLDQPGEYYYNKTSGDLYYYPASGSMDGVDVVIPTAEKIIDVKGASKDSMVHDLVFDGLWVKDTDTPEFYTFAWNAFDEKGTIGRYPDEAAGSTQPNYCSETERPEFQVGNITLTNTRNIKVTNCHVMNSGIFGIELYLANQNNEISNCLIEYTGHGGVYVDGSYPGLAGDENGEGYSRENKITNCLIHDIGELMGQASGITIMSSGWNTFSNLEIYNSPRRGIYVGGAVPRHAGNENFVPMRDLYTHHNTIEYVYFHDCQQDGGDDGALFVQNMFPRDGYKPNYFNQLLVDFVAANPSMVDIAPNCINLDGRTNGLELSNVKAVNPQHYNMELNSYVGGDYTVFTNTNMHFGPAYNHLDDFDDSLMEYDKIGVTADFPKAYAQERKAPVKPDDIYFGDDFEAGLDLRKWSYSGTKPEITTEWMSEGILFGKQSLSIDSGSFVDQPNPIGDSPVLYREFDQPLKKMFSVKFFDRQADNLPTYSAGHRIEMWIDCMAFAGSGENTLGLGTIRKENHKNYMMQIGDQLEVTSVARTAGWHELKWDYTDDTCVKMYIDDVLVKEVEGNPGFDRITLGKSDGNGQSFFDEVYIYGGEYAPPYGEAPAGPSARVNLVSGKQPSAFSENAAYDEKTVGSFTDGQKGNNSCEVTSTDGKPHWVQFDLEETYALDEIKLWYFYGNPRKYKDIIVQVSDDPTFQTGVTTLFNNDSDNSAGQGAGADEEYTSTAAGKTIPCNGAAARYVRVWSNGSDAAAFGQYTHFVEIEVFGARFEVRVNGEIANGVIATRPGKLANPYEEIEINVRPQEGYHLKADSLKVTDEAGNDVEVRFDEESGQYFFTMPCANVTVTAVFESDETPVSKDELQKLYDENENKTNDNYTDESWNAFQTALTEAKTVLDNAEATQEEVNTAKAALEAAIDGLTEKPAEKLENVIVKAVIDGDKAGAKTVWSGKAPKGAKLVDFLNENANLELPADCVWNGKWMNWDWYGHAHTEKSTVNGWTNVYVDLQKVQMVNVVVKAVENGDKSTATTLWSGKAPKGANLVEWLSENVKVEAPDGFTWDNSWMNWDWFGHKHSDKTTFNGWTNVYVNFTKN